MSYAHLQAAWSEWLIDALCSAGVRRAVVSPGSRSTPLVLAIAGAEAEGRLRAKVVVDERVAGFVALGQAKMSGVPTLLVCTSGTAGSHYLPAVIEAAQTGTPLIIVTADRPPELQERGVNQTIDQSGLFGRHVRLSMDIGAPDPDPRACSGMIRSAVRAVQAALAPDPGPVHLNARFRKPLQASPTEPAEPGELRARIDAELAAGIPRPRPLRHLPDPHDLDELAARVGRARRGVVLAGPSSVSSPVPAVELERFLDRTGFVLLPEATSQHRFGAPGRNVCDAFEPLFDVRPGHRPLQPDFVLQLGSAPAGRGLSRWLGSDDAPARTVVAARGYPEAFNRATDVWITDPSLVLAGLAERLEDGDPDPGWPHRAAAACERIWSALDELLAGADGFPEPEAVRAAVRAVPSGGFLAVGNSLPVRELDLFCPSTDRRIPVLSHRGASGIDGSLSAASGAASGSGRPAVLLVGDVSFQHDVGGLAAARDLETPLAVIVLRNGGGRLFERLPIADHLAGSRNEFERFFLTPPDVDACAAARAFGVPARRVETSSDLAGAISETLGGSGATVIEALVDGTAPAAWADALSRAAERGSDDR